MRPATPQQSPLPRLATDPMSSSASPHPPKPLSPQRERSPDSAAPSQGRAIPSAENQPTVISNRPPISTSHGSRDKTTSHLEIIKPGTHLGDIELTEHIGGGGMGQVYKGEDKRLGRPVAVKVLSREQSPDQDAVRRFLNEAKSAARLNHQNIAQVYYAGETDEHPYIVFEYVQGVNLRAMLEGHGPLMLEEALSYTIQIADALAHAAERRIVHRDVKPSNVLITPNGQAKLIDLGLARLSEPGTADRDLTASGVTLGTFDYISPEQARDPRNADSRSDIYSLGCTLFYMLAGRPPFPEGTVLQKLLQHQGDTPPDICQFRPDLPEEVGHVLGKMMAKDPRRRYPDSARLMEALLTLADLIGLHPTGPAQAVWLPPQESRISALHRQTPWLAPTLTLASLIVGLHFLWSTQERAERIDVFSRLGKQVLASGPETDTEPASQLAPGDGASNAPTSASEREATGEGTEGIANDRPGAPIMKVSTSAQTTPFPHRLGDYSTARSFESRLLPKALVGAYSPSRLQIDLSLPSLLGPVSGGLSASLPPPNDEHPPVAPIVDTASNTPLIVTDAPQADYQYGSIGAALAANPAANLIELRFDGRRVEKPFSVSSGRLTIRSGSGHTPVIAFEATSTDPVLYPRDIIQVSESELTLDGITIELSVPRRMPSDSWALIRLSSGGKANLKGCTLRILNASDTYDSYHKDIAFFRVSPRPSQAAPFTKPSRRVQSSDIGLFDCIACGEAGLVHTTEDTSLNFKWQNGLLASTEPALLVNGTSRKLPPEAALDLAWEHVTAITSGPLIRIRATEHRPHFARISFSDTSCVLDAEYLVQLNVDTLRTKPLPNSSWTSTSSVLQEGLASVISVQVDGSALDSDDLKEWLKRPDPFPAEERLVWLSGSPKGPMHAMTPNDFSLNLTETGLPPDAPAPGFLMAPKPGRLEAEASPGN